MVGAGTTRAAIRITLSDRGESVSALRRVVSISARSFAAIQFSRPQAPRLSAELPGEPSNLLEPLKRPPLGGLASAPTFVGRLSSSAPSRLSKGPPSSAREVYHPGARCQLLGPPISGGTRPGFQADRGATDPSPLGGIPLSEL
jgi:hypothetical protein